jgi:putative SOS response-associated peptidase YedK
MCGRFVVAEVGSELVSVLRIDLVAENLPAPSWNVAPTAQAAIVLDSVKTEPPTRRLESARWGLVPSWAKDPSVGARAFNARSEELEDKPMFRSAFENRRAVIPASGYYEWHTGPEGKQPYYIHPADDEPLFFAGLYEWWRDPAKADDDPTRWLLSFTILTRASAGPLADIHDRMPVVLDVDYADAWLDPTVDYQRDVLQAAYDAAPELSDTFEIRPVGSAVGNVRNDSPSLILPLPA